MGNIVSPGRILYSSYLFLCCWLYLMIEVIPSMAAFYFFLMLVLLVMPSTLLFYVYKLVRSGQLIDSLFHVFFYVAFFVICEVIITAMTGMKSGYSEMLEMVIYYDLVIIGAVSLEYLLLTFTRKNNL